MQDTAETQRLEQALLSYARQHGASKWDLRALGLLPQEDEPQLFHRAKPQKADRQLFRRDGANGHPRG